MKSYFIDTNILIYAQGAPHKYKGPCQLVLSLIATNEIYAVTSAEVLQEILYRYASLNKKALGIKMVQYSLALLHEILPIEKADLLLAMGLLDKYQALNVRDASHAASALRNNFKYILSTDKHFNQIRGLQRIDPFEV